MSSGVKSRQSLESFSKDGGRTTCHSPRCKTCKKNDPHNPTEKFGPGSYVDLGAYSPDKKRKRKATKKGARSIQEES